MKCQMRNRLVLAATAVAFFTAPAMADHGYAHREDFPTEWDVERINETLQAAGFTKRYNLERDDDGYWEVNDAQHLNGYQYDLKVDPDTYEILRSDADW